jgi:polyhydroxybutyrate depolymerase
VAVAKRNRVALGVGLVLLLSCGLLPGSGAAARASTPRRPAVRSMAAVSLVATPIATTGCGKRPPIPAGTSANETLPSGGIARAYRLHVPRGYHPGRYLPLVLSFHGHGSTARAQERLTGFSALADHDDFLVAYPQGTVGPDGQTGWATGPRKDPTVDDVRFVADLLTRLQATLCVDPARIYATGFSNGGAMTAMLACTLAARIAAFAPVAGSYFPFAGGCRPRRPVSLLEIHGTADPVVPYDGSRPLRLPTIAGWLAQWAARDGCARRPQIFMSLPPVMGERWTGCRAGALVVHYRLAGGLHAWPAFLFAPRPARRMGATAVIWAFLAAHSLGPLRLSHGGAY